MNLIHILLSLISYIQNIATISATQNSSTLEFFSQLLYSSLSSIQATSYITSKDRHRLHSLTAQENTMHMVLVGNSLVKGWNEKLLEIVLILEFILYD